MERYSTVKISATRMGSYILSPRLTVRSISEENTSGPLGRLRVNPVVNDPSLTGNPIMVPATSSKNKSKSQTETSSSERSSLYTLQLDV